MATTEPDLYAVLGVTTGASAAEIKSAFKREMKVWHPDTNAHRPAEATRQATLINRAHDVLSNVEARAAYDARRRGTGRARGGARPTADDGPQARDAAQRREREEIEQWRAQPEPALAFSDHAFVAGHWYAHPEKGVYRVEEVAGERVHVRYRDGARSKFIASGLWSAWLGYLHARGGGRPAAGARRDAPGRAGPSPASADHRPAKRREQERRDAERRDAILREEQRRAAERVRAEQEQSERERVARARRDAAARVRDAAIERAQREAAERASREAAARDEAARREAADQERSARLRRATEARREQTARQRDEESDRRARETAFRDALGRRLDGVAAAVTADRATTAGAPSAVSRETAGAAGSAATPARTGSVAVRTDDPLGWDDPAFVAGHWYAGAEGVYEVLDVQDDQIALRGADGDERTDDLARRWRAWLNLKARLRNERSDDRQSRGADDVAVDARRLASTEGVHAAALHLAREGIVTLVDRRPERGPLFIIPTEEDRATIDHLFRELRGQGLPLTYARGGGGVTDGRPAWLTR